MGQVRPEPTTALSTGFTVRGDTNCVLCGNLCVPLRAEDIQHIAQRGQDTALKHIEDSGSTAADQGDTLLVLRDRLLLITALNIPEYHPGQLITGFRIVIAAGALFVVFRPAFETVYIELPHIIPDAVEILNELAVGHSISPCQCPVFFHSTMNTAVCTGFFRFISVPTPRSISEHDSEVSSVERQTFLPVG